LPFALMSAAAAFCIHGGERNTAAALLANKESDTGSS
jgi:hypothetical protein